MTFQIGMVASDGILLASDRLRLSATGQGPATSEEAPKIIIVPSKHIAYCCAGDNLATAVGKEIEDKLDDSSYRDINAFFRDCIETTIGVDRSGRGGHWEGGSVLVVCRDVSPELWKLHFSKENKRDRAALRIERGFVIAGDEGNYARFFLERYFLKYMRPKPTMSQLVPLASHTVVNAAKLNPRGIGGLELVLCAGGKFEPLARERVMELEDSAVQFSAEIKNRLLS